MATGYYIHYFNYVEGIPHFHTYQRNDTSLMSPLSSKDTGTSIS